MGQPCRGAWRGLVTALWARDCLLVSPSCDQPLGCHCTDPRMAETGKHRPASIALLCHERGWGLTDRANPALVPCLQVWEAAEQGGSRRWTDPWTSICIFRSHSQPVGCLQPPHSLFKGPEHSGRMHRGGLSGIPQRPARCPQGSPCPASPGEQGRGGRAARAGVLGWRWRGWGSSGGICSVGGAAGCSVPGSPSKEQLGNLCGVAPILGRTCLVAFLSSFVLLLGLFLQFRGASASF